MNIQRKIFRDVGDALLKTNAVLISGIIGIFISSIVAVSEPFRKVYLQVNIFNLGIILSVIIETITLAFFIIIFSVLMEVFFKWTGKGIVWLSQHKRGNSIAKIDLKVIESSSENDKLGQEFIVRVRNKENLDVYNVIVFFGIFGPINSKNENRVAGNLNGLWMKEKISNGGSNLDGEYRVNIPSGKERDLFFIKTDKKEREFSIKFSSGENKFSTGRYILKILFYGEMVNKQVIGEQSGEIVFYDNGQIEFDLKKVKKNRGFISLVKGTLWNSINET